ncbi:MAG: hypothetical protein WC294_10745 [Methanoregula sp.]
MPDLISLVKSSDSAQMRIQGGREKIQFCQIELNVRNLPADLLIQQIRPGEKKKNLSGK